MKNKENKIPMPNSVAAWLIENTDLTFEQISNFCDINLMSINAIANGHQKFIPLDPIKNGILDAKELEYASKNKDYEMQAIYIQTHSKKTFSSKEKAQFIKWIIQRYPFAKDHAIAKILKTTKPTISKIRDTQDFIDALNPVKAGACNEKDIDKILS